MEDFIHKLLNIRNKVRSSAPLIHCITNPISINDCANAVLALGGKPIMAEHPFETADITAAAKALSVNLGNITDVRLQGINAAAESSRNNGVPLIIDAVGVTCSRIRKDFCLEFIEKFKPEIIKGNRAEIKALLGQSFAATGIDSAETDVNSAVAGAKALSKKAGSVVVSSGSVDVIAFGDGAVLVRNGCEMMSLVTGTGCMLGVIIATFMSAGSAFESAVLGCGYFGVCGERSSDAKGTASFRIDMIDNIYSIDDKTLKDKLKIEFV